jgi:hypothetical protein
VLLAMIMFDSPVVVKKKVTAIPSLSTKKGKTFLLLLFQRKRARR